MDPGLALLCPRPARQDDSDGGSARWGGCSAAVPTLRMLSAASALPSRTEVQRVGGITRGPFAVSRRLDWSKELGLMVHPFCWIRSWRKRVEGNKTAVSRPVPGGVLGPSQVPRLILPPALGTWVLSAVQGPWDARICSRAGLRPEAGLNKVPACGSEQPSQAPHLSGLYFYDSLIMDDHILSSKQLGQTRLTWFSLHSQASGPSVSFRQACPSPHAAPNRCSPRSGLPSPTHAGQLTWPSASPEEAIRCPLPHASSCGQGRVG